MKLGTTVSLSEIECEDNGKLKGSKCWTVALFCCSDHQASVSASAPPAGGEGQYNNNISTAPISQPG